MILKLSYMTLRVFLLTEAEEWGLSGWLCTVEVFTKCTVLYHSVSLSFSHLHNHLLDCIILYLLFPHQERGLMACIILFPSSFPHQERHLLACIILYPSFPTSGKGFNGLYHSLSFFFPPIRRGIYWPVSFCILLLSHIRRGIYWPVSFFVLLLSPIRRGIYWPVSFCILLLSPIRRGV
jgi:hypothetical protein